MDKAFKGVIWGKCALFLFLFPHEFNGHGKHISTTFCIYPYSVITLGCIHLMNK